MAVYGRAARSRSARSGPRNDERIIKSAVEAAILIDDDNVCMSTLAIIACVDVSVMYAIK